MPLNKDSVIIETYQLQHRIVSISGSSKKDTK